MTASLAPTQSRVYTTGQVAKICKVAPRTVSKWFDSGRLKGYRIPGSQDRRVPHERLLEFLNSYQLPHAFDAPVLLWVGCEPWGGSIGFAFPEPDFRVLRAAGPFDAGLLIAAESSLAVAVIRFTGVGRAEALALAASLRRHASFEGGPVIAIVAEDEVDPGALADRHSFAAMLVEPTTPAAVCKAVRKTLGGK